MTSIIFIQPKQVSIAWPYVAPALKTYPWMPIEKIYHDALDGRVQIWTIGPRAIALTCVTERPEEDCSVLEVLYLYGKCGLQLLRAFGEAMMKMKDHVGAHRIEFKTDRKIDRVLKAHNCHKFGDTWWRET